MKKEKDLKKYLNAYREANFSWELAQTFLQQPDDLDWVWFFDKIMEIHWKKKDKSKGHTSRKKVHTYTPGTSFPSISVTGSDCELHCAHCNKKYLHHMKDAKTPNNFKEVLKSLKQK